MKRLSSGLWCFSFWRARHFGGIYSALMLKRRQTANWGNACPSESQTLDVGQLLSHTEICECDWENLTSYWNYRERKYLWLSLNLGLLLNIKSFPRFKNISIQYSNPHWRRLLLVLICNRVVMQLHDKRTHNQIFNCYIELDLN
jgi:hypothetical protein